MDGQHLNQVVSGEHVSIIRVIQEIKAHHSGYLGDHCLLAPATVVLIKVHSVLSESCVELGPHNGRLNDSQVPRVDEVTSLSDSEPDKCDAHTVIIEEDVRVRAGCVNRGRVMESQWITRGLTFAPTVSSSLSGTAPVDHSLLPQPPPDSHELVLPPEMGWRNPMDRVIHHNTGHTEIIMFQRSECNTCDILIMNLTTNPLRPDMTSPTRVSSQNTELSQEWSWMSRNLLKWWTSDQLGSRMPHLLCVCISSF